MLFCFMLLPLALPTLLFLLMQATLLLLIAALLIFSWVATLRPSLAHLLFPLALVAFRIRLLLKRVLTTHTPSASVLSASLHPDHDNVEDHNRGADSGSHIQQTSAANSSIFDRSTILSNRAFNRPLDDHGARTRGAGKAAAQHRSACTLNFDGLSAQALASERGHSIPAAMRAPSLFELRTSAPASPLVASVLAASPATDADVTCSSHVGPGWGSPHVVL